MEVIDIVKEIAVEAAKLLREEEKDKKIYAKKSLYDRHDVVTSVDFAVEKFVCERLRDAFPAYQIFTEETDFDDVTSEYFWSLDPVDGTKNFAAGLPLVGISIGLLREFVPVLGVIINPYTGELYSAEAGKGAYKNGEPIHVSATDKLSDSMLIIEGKDVALKGRRYLGKLSRDARSIRNLGVATINLCYLAEGKVQAYIDEDLKYYDICAGTVILQEAGGKLTDTRGEPVFPRKPDFADIDVVGSNGILHDTLIGYISEG